MKALLFASAHNRKGKRDGDEFVREMYKFEHHLETEEANVKAIECYEKRYPDRRKEFLAELGQVDTVGLFCHGSKKWIYGIGYHVWNITHLARYLKKSHDKNYPMNIILYACSCGKGKGTEYPVGQVPKKAGVAMMLANELAELDSPFKITAHTTKGHTTRNPNCVFVTEKDGIIYKETVIPRVTRWQGKTLSLGRRRWLKWIKLLRDDPTFRFEFPFLEQHHILKILDEIND